MVATVLANSRNLFRILVPRSLLLQSAQVLQSKLGDLVGRSVIHLPFSRKTPTENSLIELFAAFHETTRQDCGIVLALPEHILSFRLSGIQRMCDKNTKDAELMIKMQRQLDKLARDVLDECDVSLSVRTQLIYPSGSQVSVDGHPLRWQVVQSVLHLVASHAEFLQKAYPQSIEVHFNRPDAGYPLIYFLRKDAEEALLAHLVQEISHGHTSILPSVEYSKSERICIQEFIDSAVVSTKTINSINELFKETEHLKKTLYLLRGLFVHRILLLTLKKRWNVQYGLHPFRDPVAVPYLAKGVPSNTSEWGHPDVTILLTCLSFYYSGLNANQFRQAFEHLLKADEPSVEYEKWVIRGVPENLRDFNSINSEDSHHLEELLQHVRFNTHLADFYLNSFVFPRHAKQFQVCILIGPLLN